MNKKTEMRLREPGAAYRGKPFWAWNGALDEAELLRQIDCMRAMGFGGFFMYSRTGLDTEYLGGGKNGYALFAVVRSMGRNKGWRHGCTTKIAGRAVPAAARSLSQK